MVDVEDCVAEDLDVLIHSARPRSMKNPPLGLVRVRAIALAVIDEARAIEF